MPSCQPVDQLSDLQIASHVSPLGCQTDTLGWMECYYYFKETNMGVLLPQFMSNKSSVILLMDVKP